VEISVDYKINFTACNSRWTKQVFLPAVSTKSKIEAPSEILFSTGWDRSSWWDQQWLL